MYARVASFEGGDEQQLLELNRQAAASGTMEMPAGLKRVLILGGNSDRKRLFVTLFDSREELDAAEERFNSMGDEISEAVRGRRTSVDVYEVMLDREV